MAEQEPAETKGKSAELPAELRYIQYEHALEKQYLPSIRALISKDLSEPYSIYVYRYFLYQWGDLCFMVFDPFPLSPAHFPRSNKFAGPRLHQLPHRRHNMQARNPPIALPSHTTRIHCYARRVLGVEKPRDRHNAGEESD